MNKIIAAVVVVLAACIAVPLLAVAGPGSSAGCAGSHIVASTDGLDWDAEQRNNVAVIVEIGAGKGVPPWGFVVATATAMQESRLRNLPHLGDDNDHDSIGLFQQRPSQGWGTPQQLASPAYQAGKFFDALLRVNGWQQMPLTAAAQAVQRSAYPDAYARWTAEALRLVSQVHLPGLPALAGSLQGCSSLCMLAASEAVGGAPGGCADGSVLARARTWLTAWNGGPVPYLSSGDPATWFHGYRRDCSGYASMALGLPGPGLTTAQLAAASAPITKEQLRPGDLLINPAPDGDGHVVIFDRWENRAMTRYLGYEQSGDGGTHHRSIPYPYYGTYHLDPYRPHAEASMA